MDSGDRRNKDLHIFQCKGLEFAYDVNSGSLLQVDQLAGEVMRLLVQGFSRDEVVLRLKDRFDQQELLSVFQEIGRLQREQVIFTPPAVRGPTASGPQAVKALCLLVSQDCNLSCRYCFARDGQDQSVLNMPWEVGRKAVDFLLAQGSGRFREIDFFGGEPLLNFPVVKGIVQYAREKAGKVGVELAFTLTTNASLLNDEIIDFLNRENISVVLSLDGRPQVHDSMRKTHSGKGSYQETLQNINRLLEQRNYRDYYIRGTYTKNNLDFSLDAEHLIGLGFDSLSLEPVIGTGDDFALTEEDLPFLEAEYDRLTDIYLEQKREGTPFLFYHFHVDLEQGPCLYKRISGCGAGTEYLAVAPDGRLYPCHQFAGNEDYLAGNILDVEQLKNNPRLQELYDAPRIHQECNVCWARYLCGYGCAAANLTQVGHLEKNHALSCALQKMRLEKALYLQAV